MRAHDDFRSGFVSDEIADDVAGIADADVRRRLELLLLKSVGCRGEGFFAFLAVMALEACFAGEEFDVDVDDEHLHVE